MIRYFIVLVLLVIVVLRTRPAFFGPLALRRKARPGWAAACVAALAFLALGAVIPSVTLDSWLGGTNILHLVRNLLAVTAIWLLRSAVMVLQESYSGSSEPRPKRHSPWVLLAIVILITVPFLFINRGSSATDSFMTVVIGQAPAVVYAVIYMLAMAWIGADMALALTARVRSFFFLFVAGGWAIVIASLDEIAYLILGHFSFGPAWFIELTRGGFYPLLYLGVALVAIGLTVRPVRRRIEDYGISHYRRVILKIVDSKGEAIASLLWPEGNERKSASNADVSDLYRFAIALRDWETKGTNQLSEAERRKIMKTEAIFEKNTRQTVQIPGRVVPDEVPSSPHS